MPEISLQVRSRWVSQLSLQVKSQDVGQVQLLAAVTPLAGVLEHSPVLSQRIEDTQPFWGMGGGPWALETLQTKLALCCCADLFCPPPKEDFKEEILGWAILFRAQLVL